MALAFKNCLNRHGVLLSLCLPARALTGFSPPAPLEDAGCLGNIVRRDWLHFKCVAVLDCRRRTVEETQAEKAGDEAADMRFPGDLPIDAGREAEQAGGEIDHHPDAEED